MTASERERARAVGLLPELLGGPDREGATRAMQAMLQMTKIDVAKLREAYEGVPA